MIDFYNNKQNEENSFMEVENKNANKNANQCFMNMMNPMNVMNPMNMMNPMSMMQQSFMMQMQFMQNMTMMQMQLIQEFMNMMSMNGTVPEGNGQDAAGGAVSAPALQQEGFKLGNVTVPPELLKKLMQMEMSPENLEKLQKVLDFVLGSIPEQKK